MSGVLIQPWLCVCYVSLAASLGAIIASRFEGVALSPRAFLYVTLIPALLCQFTVDAAVRADVALFTVIFVAGLSCLAVIDAKSRTIPDLISVPMILVGLMHASFSGFDTVVFATSALSVIALGLTGQFLFKEVDWFGGGDVLLVAGALAWFGPVLVIDIVLLSALVLVPQLIVAKTWAMRPSVCLPVQGPATGVPFAPAFGFAQMVIWFLGPVL